MYKTCPKCGYTRKAADTAPPGTCPSCGLIFEKYDAAMAQAVTHRQEIRPVERAEEGTGAGKMIVYLLLAATVAAGIFYFKSKPRSPGTAVQLANAGVISQGTRIEEFEPLFNSNFALSKLARAGEYTVVEVYLDTCPYCRKLEAALVPFMDRRKDVGLVRVHHPGALNIQIQGNSQEEVQRQAAEMNARIKAYEICGTPHVEIYGPDRNLIASDNCAKKTGTSFVWNWIAQETGITPDSATGGTRL